MPVERRSLRSNSKSDTSSSTNGEKARSNSQNSTSNKDKAAPTTRSAANKAKTAPAKKGAAKSAGSSNNSNAGDKPHTNGSDPVENGVNGVEDVEMEEDTAGGPTSSIQTNKDHDGDEMTVVVPPSKGSRLSGQPGQDNKKDEEEDVAMEGAEEKGAEETVPEIDPRTKAVQGELT
jgi:26S proteasome regulatory subunit N3